MEISSIKGIGANESKSDAQLKEVENMKDGEIWCAELDGPPDGFQFVLPFLDVPSRLNVEKVSKPLRQALKDPLVWVDLRMGGRACRRLTDEILLKLVERADGHLKSLFLVDALEITDETLSKISELNPGLERISVPGCTGVDVEEFVSLVEAHSLKARVKGLPGISQVRIGGLCDILPEHLLRLKNALGVSSSPQKEASRSRRYYGYLNSDNGATDKRPVDVELCPDCDEVGLIYDCTSDKHRVEKGGCNDDISTEDTDSDDVGDDDCRSMNCSSEDADSDDVGDDDCMNCRSCLDCIPRCGECGTCITTDPFDTEEGLLCSHSLCADCQDDDLHQCIECERHACHRHEKECFPHGFDRVCCECMTYFIEGETTESFMRRQLDFDDFGYDSPYYYGF